MSDPSLFTVPAVASALFVLIWVGYAALRDLLFRRIPNVAALTAIVCGLAIHPLWLLGVSHASLSAVGLSLLASLCLFVVLFLAWSAGVVGAGDAKLWFAASLLLPPTLLSWETDLLATLATGGLLSIGYLAQRVAITFVPLDVDLIHNGRLALRRWVRVERRRVLNGVGRQRNVIIPYGVAIFAGAAAAELPAHVAMICLLPIIGIFATISLVP